MEVAVKLEDDLFFADISRQISLLIMDDDDDPIANFPSVAFQDFSRGSDPTLPSSFTYEQTYRRESKGTGVFIPMSSQPRRKHRHGRHSNSYKTKRQPDNARMASHQVQYSSSLCPKKS